MSGDNIVKVGLCCLHVRPAIPHLYKLIHVDNITPGVFLPRTLCGKIKQELAFIYP